MTKTITQQLDAFDNKVGTYYGFSKNLTCLSPVWSGGTGYRDEWKACERNGSYVGPSIKDLIHAHLSYVNREEDHLDELDYEHFKTKLADLDRQNYVYVKSTNGGYGFELI
jgi:hypothetical protein